MIESTYMIPEGELRITQDVADVFSYSRRLDKEWTFVDRQGHEHHRDNGYPTLTEVTDEVYWCHDCSDEHEDTHLECRICGEHIEPGLLPPSTAPERIPGAREYYLNDARITEERFNELINRR